MSKFWRASLAAMLGVISLWLAQSCQSTPESAPSAQCTPENKDCVGPCEVLDLPFAGASDWGGQMSRPPVVEYSRELDVLSHDELEFQRQPGLSLGSLARHGTPFETQFPQLDALSFGLDWIPMSPESFGRLAPLTTVDDEQPGFGILFFELNGVIYAYGWGACIDQSWTLDGQPGGVSGLVPLHQMSGVLPAGAVGVSGLDFNSWFHSPLPQPACIELQAPTVEPQVRMFFSVRSGSVPGVSGASIWYARPEVNVDGTPGWTVCEWIRPEQLGLTPEDDVVALAYDMVSGVLVFSLAADPPPQFGLGIGPAPFYVVEVGEFVGCQPPTLGEPTLLRTENNLPFGTLELFAAGPRPGGTCGIDPRIR